MLRVVHCVVNWRSTLTQQTGPLAGTTQLRRVLMGRLNVREKTGSSPECVCVCVCVCVCTCARVSVCVRARACVLKDSQRERMVVFVLDCSIWYVHLYCTCRRECMTTLETTDWKAVGQLAQLWFFFFIVMCDFLRWGGNYSSIIHPSIHPSLVVLPLSWKKQTNKQESHTNRTVWSYHVTACNHFKGAPCSFGG